MKISLIIIIILAVLVIGCIWIIHRDMNRFVVRHYEIHSDKLKKDGKFVLLSDLHEKSFGENNSELIAAIRDINPDAVLIAGDLITGHNERSRINTEPALLLVENLAKDYPVYAANGNHEYKMDLLGGWWQEEYRKYEKRLLDAGVVLLRNTGTYLEDYNMEIHGLEADYIYYKKLFKTPMDDDYINGFFGKPCEARFQLLIAHNPIYFPEYAKWGADLIVSGHVHGGIIRLPLVGGVISPALVLFPKYDGGLFDIGDKHMILSRGLSTHTIHVRFNNPGEVCVINLKADKQ